jgi:hypothetical protein
MTNLKFIGEKIEVKTDTVEPHPISFQWRGRQYVIQQIIRAWQDHGFSQASPKKRTWKLRHHRNVYRVLTDSGEKFEIYLERGSGRRIWYLYTQLD